MGDVQGGWGTQRLLMHAVQGLALQAHLRFKGYRKFSIMSTYSIGRDLLPLKIRSYQPGPWQPLRVKTLALHAVSCPLLIRRLCVRFDRSSNASTPHK